MASFFNHDDDDDGGVGDEHGAKASLPQLPTKTKATAKSHDVLSSNGGCHLEHIMCRRGRCIRSNKTSTSEEHLAIITIRHRPNCFSSQLLRKEDCPLRQRKR